METKPKMSFVQAMLDFFGKNGKDTANFMVEMKALSNEEKAYFRNALGKYYEIA